MECGYRLEVKIKRVNIHSDQTQIVMDKKIRRIFKSGPIKQPKGIDIRKFDNPAVRTQVSRMLENWLKKSRKF